MPKKIVSTIREMNTKDQPLLEHIEQMLVKLREVATSWVTQLSRARSLRDHAAEAHRSRIRSCLMPTGRVKSWKKACPKM